MGLLLDLFVTLNHPVLGCEVYVGDVASEIIKMAIFGLECKILHTILCVRSYTLPILYYSYLEFLRNEKIGQNPGYLVGFPTGS